MDNKLDIEHIKNIITAFKNLTDNILSGLEINHEHEDNFCLEHYYNVAHYLLNQYMIYTEVVPLIKDIALNTNNKKRLEAGIHPIYETERDIERKSQQAELEKFFTNASEH